MRGIFISYRRDDSAGYAGRLFDVLHEHLGEDRVFMDVTDIAPGADFVQTLARGLQEADAVLVMIGPRWASATTVEGRLRLWEPDDFVRKEVATALTSGRRVVPVLVQGAGMPRDEQLPAELQGLLRRQAVVLSDARWQRDCEDLLQELAPRSAAVAPSHLLAQSAPAPRSAQWKGLVAGLVVIGALAGGIAADRAGLVPFASAFALPWSQRAVPNVIGLQRAEAERVVQAAGFQLAEPALAREAQAPHEAHRTVVAQRPPGGERLARGSSIALTLSARPAEAQVEVPNLMLHTVSEARAALARRGLKLGQVEARSGAAKPGLVLEQSVPALARVAAGSAVSLVIAAATVAPTEVTPAPVTPPVAPSVAPSRTAARQSADDSKAGPSQSAAAKQAKPPQAPQSQDRWAVQASEPVRVTVEALCGRRVLLAYHRCLERECAKAVHADDPLCRQQPPVAAGGN